MNRTQWLAERQTCIGASDAPSIIGLGWSTAADVYRSKVEPVKPDNPTGYQRLGTELEGFIGRLYSETMNIEVRPCGFDIARHPERPWQGATPDFIRPDGLYMQAKTLAGFDGESWGPSGTDEIPPGYRAQVIQEMGVTGTDMIDLAALCRISGEFRVYRIGFDRGVWDWLTEVEGRFWGHVERREPVGPEWEEQFAVPLPILQEKSIPDLGPDAAALVARWQEYGGIKKESEAEYQRLSQQVKTLMGENKRAVAGDWKLNYVIVPAHEVKASHRVASSHVRALPVKERIKK